MTLLDLVSRDTMLRKVASTRGGEYAGPCPWCGGRDRFRVWPNAERPGYWCRRCGKKGDAIQYLRDHDGLRFQEACERLQIPQAERSRIKRLPQPPRLASAPSHAWQAKARQFTEACEAALWMSVGAKALGYLHSRSLHDETLQVARVGYHTTERWDKREAWGLEPDDKNRVWLPQGIVFPWWCGGQLWRVVIRTPQSKPEQPKYVSVSGSRNTLYRVDTLRPKAPAMIVEGVLDSLAIAQDAGDLIAVVAAGSTTGGRLERWIGRLALASTVLVAVDADEAGEAAVAWWLKALGTRAKRWRPYWDDPSAMLQDGADLRTWVREGLGLQPKWWREVAHWPEDRRELWAERACILEIEGGLPREEAERRAFAENRCTG